MVENQSGCHIKVLHTDRGGEFIYKEFNLFCEEEGIQKELTTPYTPEQNGIAEQKKSNYYEDGKKYVTSKETSKLILGRSRSNICLSIKPLTNKGCYESNSL